MVVPTKGQEAVESLYLDHPVLRRFSEPNNLLHPKPRLLLSKSGTDGGTEEGMFNLLAIERALKKGMMKQSLPPPPSSPPPPPPPPLSARRVSLPVLGPSASQAKAATSRDLFPAVKDKEESQEESIYVECEPTTASMPCKVLPCPIPACPLKRTRPQISPSGPQKVLAENLPEDGCLKSGSLPDDSGMQNKAWYAGSCDRRTAEAALLRYNKDSAYMVRQSSRQGWNQPFTLVVLFNNHVYNIPIRYLEGSHQYMLGKDGKSHKKLFDSVSSIIQTYTEHPLVLIDGSTSAKEQTCLLFPVKP
ncbi:SH2 domain-containing protein 6-like [Rhineura floridana]|uniref:SH2 domain-containing protein 6-like n=1 Tax=Rhineura floridana TaxID=261503 RepID=UPI002AC80A0E|nr:SH2 domain-containing protein 6-like [Rhineura floridana]